MSLGLEITLVGIDESTASKTPPPRDPRSLWEDFIIVNVISKPSFSDCKNINHRYVSKSF